MTRHNRVTPFGEIVALPERGTVMGNRGRLHDEAGRIRRPWQVKRWLLCRLEFNGRRRVVMAPDRYTNGTSFRSQSEHWAIRLRNIGYEHSAN
jgi:hypothetical protein